MQNGRLAVFIVHRSITKLEQFVGQHTGRTSRNPCFRVNLQKHIPLQSVIGRLCLCIQLHGDFLRDAVGQGQIVGGFHADANIADEFVNAFRRTVFGLVRPYGHGVSLVRHKEDVAVGGDSPAQPFTAVQQIDLRPEVGQPVRGRRTRQFNQPLYPGAHHLESLESNRLVIFEAGGFIQHHAVKRPHPFTVGGVGVIVNQPFHVVAVDDVHICRLFKRSNTLCG